MSAITRGQGTSIYGTVGTTSASALASNVGRNFLQIENTSATASIAYTLDGTTPVVNGAGFTLGPLGSATYDVFCPTGAINVIASGTSTPYSILWA